jgi:serine/threonine-protein kinase HipA
MDFKALNQIVILRNGVKAGILERTKTGCRIELDTEFQRKNDRLTFGISAAEKIYEFRGVGLPPYFAGLLPEGLRLKALVKKVKTSQDDLFTLLVACGGDPIGDIHFKPHSASDDQLGLPNDFKVLKKHLYQGLNPGKDTLSGVQDKLSADRISLPISIRKKAKSYILKLSSSEFPDLIYNESSCLRLARQCGLIVNKTEIVKDKNSQEALLVERFDRERDQLGKGWVRFHQEDACQFTNRYPADKYLISFQEIADEIARLSTSPEIEILNLLKLKAFSYLIGNGDFHAKNVSLIQRHQGDICGLTPFYDIICTALYGDTKMALMFLGKNQNLKRKMFIEFGLRYRIPEVATGSMLDRLVNRFGKNQDNFFSFPLALQRERFLRQFFKERLKHLS